MTINLFFQQKRSSKWSYGNSNAPTVQTIVSQEFLSIGDALRELDAKQIISSDFILIAGDVVSNLELNKVMEEHK